MIRFRFWLVLALFAAAAPLPPAYAQQDSPYVDRYLAPGCGEWGFLARKFVSGQMNSSSILNWPLPDEYLIVKISDAGKAMAAAHDSLAAACRARSGQDCPRIRVRNLRRLKILSGYGRDGMIIHPSNILIQPSIQQLFQQMRGPCRHYLSCLSLDCGEDPDGRDCLSVDTAPYQETSMQRIAEARALAQLILKRDLKLAGRSVKRRKGVQARHDAFMALLDQGAQEVASWPAAVAASGLCRRGH